MFGVWNVPNFFRDVANSCPPSIKMLISASSMPWKATACETTQLGWMHHSLSHETNPLAGNPVPSGVANCDSHSPNPIAWLLILCLTAVLEDLEGSFDLTIDAIARTPRRAHGKSKLCAFSCSRSVRASIKSLVVSEIHLAGLSTSLPGSLILQLCLICLGNSTKHSSKRQAELFQKNDSSGRKMAPLTFMGVTNETR